MTRCMASFRVPLKGFPVPSGLIEGRFRDDMNFSPRALSGVIFGIRQIQTTVPMAWI